MADKVADVNEKLASPEKKSPEKKVIEAIDDLDDDSKTSEIDTNGDALKENGTSDEKDSADDSDKLENGSKNGENGHAKDDDDCGVEVVASKRKSGGDAPVGTPAEGASPEKKAKLADPVEAEANGDTEAAA